MFLLQPHTRWSFPSYYHHLCSLRTSVLNQVSSVSRRLLRTHETRRTIATTKPATQREGLPLSCRLNQSRSSTVGLWRRSQARSKQACSGPIHVHGSAKCSPFTIESIYGKLQLHARLGRAGQSSAGKRATSTAVDSTGLQAGHSPQESCS